MFTRLFVYGTLLGGELRHAALSSPTTLFHGASLIRFPGRMVTHESWSWPALIKGNTVSIIKGEIYLIDAEMVERVNHVQGYPVLFYKEEFQTTERLSVVTYVLQPERVPSEGLIEISHGDWRKYQHAD